MQAQDALLACKTLKTQLTLLAALCVPDFMACLRRRLRLSGSLWKSLHPSFALVRAMRDIYPSLRDSGLFGGPKGARLLVQCFYRSHPFPHQPCLAPWFACAFVRLSFVRLQGQLEGYITSCVRRPRHLANWRIASREGAVAYTWRILMPLGTAAVAKADRL